MAFEGLNSTTFNKMELGLTRARDSFEPKHPIEMSEKSYRENLQKGIAEQMRQTQGFSAPLCWAFERSAVSKVGHLPCITNRSRIQLEILDNRDIQIDFDDIYGRPEMSEQMVRPHDIIEKCIASKEF